MRILYGVQGTGNGHISRARAMAPALARTDIEVDWLFTGRDAERLFDMECFGDFQTRAGLTFVYADGRVNYPRTILGNNYWHFVRDVWRLDVRSYDLVVTDFEPVSAWAGKLRGTTVISVGHQPAFDYRVPVAGKDLATTLLMRVFAPGTVRVGMHWDSFDAPLLPPLIDVEHPPTPVQERKVLVYLPFENRQAVEEVLRSVPGFEFYVYFPGSRHSDEGHLHLRPTSLDGFRADLADCAAVVCNAGFELSSECLSLGKRLLVKPLDKQMEQTSNALALETLGYGSVLHRLQGQDIRHWLESDVAPTHIAFPDVANALARWIAGADFSAASVQTLSDSLWKQVRVSGRPQPATGKAPPWQVRFQ